MCRRNAILLPKEWGYGSFVLTSCKMACCFSFNTSATSCEITDRLKRSSENKYKYNIQIGLHTIGQPTTCHQNKCTCSSHLDCPSHATNIFLIQTFYMCPTLHLYRSTQCIASYPGFPQTHNSTRHFVCLRKAWVRGYMYRLSKFFNGIHEHVQYRHLIRYFW